MAQTETKFITDHDHFTYRLRQDDDIRREFGRQASLIEEGNQQLREDLNATFNDKLSTVSGSLNGKLGELNNELGGVKNDLRDLKDEMGQVKDEVGQVKLTLADFGARLERIEKVRLNATKSRPWEAIERIGRFVPGKGYEEPSYFPKDAGEFWRLKRNPTERNIRRLIFLVNFYGIDDYQHWDRTQSEEHAASDVDDVQSDEEGQSHSESVLSALSLEDAVQQYPSRAVERVAAVLGLVEENFAGFYQGALKHQQRPQVIEKRPQLQRDWGEEDTKRQKLQPRSSPPVPKPTLSFSELLLKPKSESLHSDETRVSYAHSSTALKAIPRLHQDRPQSRTPSATYPDGSPTMPNESPRPNEDVNRISSGMQGKPNSPGS